MNTLIVVAHPDQDSLTHHVARRLRDALEPEGEVVVADLHDEGFDPRFSMSDRRDYRSRSVTDPVVLAEQRRIDAADHLVLVFPVYWWSMPALLKGWIDRVFITGWAFDYDEDDRLDPRLGALTTHLVPVSATSRESFARHGYSSAFSTQVEHGIVDFCGSRRGVTAFVHDSESTDAEVIEREVHAAVASVATSIGAPVTAPATATASAQGPSR